MDTALCAGLLTPYFGIVVLSEGIRQYPNAVCGLPTTSAVGGSIGAEPKCQDHRTARLGGRETTNGASGSGLRSLRVKLSSYGVRRPAHNRRVDGALVGGASLVAAQFLAIAQAAG